MSRLSHSPKGLLRSLQISRRKLFAYCEGEKADKFFYSQIIRHSTACDTDEFQISHGKEATGTGGKQALIKLFKRLRRNRSLNGEFKGKRFSCVFFLDKDADCILRRKLRSDNVIYTSLYDVEAHCFRHSNLLKALAGCMSVDFGALSAVFSDAEKWCNESAVRWKKWLALCLFSEKYKVHVGCGFGRPSQINDPSALTVDRVKFDDFAAKLEKNSGFNRADFGKKFASISNLLEKMENSGKLFTIFKGKWLRGIIEADIGQMSFGCSYNFNGLGERLLSSLLVLLDFTAEWCAEYILSVRRVFDFILVV